MKKILLAIFVASLACTSCTLDVTPETAVTFTNFLKTEQDYERTLYQIQWNVKLLNESTPLETAGALADTLKYNSGTWKFKSRDLPMYTSSGITNWARYYDIIYLSNVILENSSRTHDLDQDKIKFYVGQSYFTKAMAYYWIARKWGEAIVITSTQNQKAYAKSSMIDVINECITCGEEAFKRLPTYEKMPATALKSKQYGNLGSTAALLSYAYAWKAYLVDTYHITGEDSRQALTKSVYWATEIIEGRTGSTYRLEANPYALVTVGLKGCIDGNFSNESIFELETDLVQNAPILYSIIHRPQFWPFAINSSHESHYTEVEFGIRPKGLEAIYEKDVDKRLPAFFSDGRCKPGEESPEKWITPGPEIRMAFPRKVRDFKTSVSPATGATIFRTYTANAVIWRLADIILLRAESNAKLGNNAPAITDINTIRNRAGATLYPGPRDSQDVRYTVFKEREKELVFEGHRFYDAVRNGYLGEISPEYGALTQDDIQKGALFLPVGSGAFNRNDLMRQNQYWIQFEN